MMMGTCVRVESLSDLPPGRLCDIVYVFRVMCCCYVLLLCVVLV
jgi:hypothetical protein